MKKINITLFGANSIALLFLIYTVLVEGPVSGNALGDLVITTLGLIFSWKLIRDPHHLSWFGEKLEAGHEVNMQISNIVVAFILVGTLFFNYDYVLSMI